MNEDVLENGKSVKLGDDRLTGSQRAVFYAALQLYPHILAHPAFLRDGADPALQSVYHARTIYDLCRSVNRP